MKTERLLKSLRLREMAKNKGGRPTVMTPETLKKLEEAFLNGATDEQACFYADISHQTLYNYQDKHPEFLERKRGLKGHLLLIAKNNIARKIREGDVNQSQWMLERKDKEFSNKASVDHTTNGKDLTITAILGEIDGRTSGLPED